MKQPALNDVTTWITEAVRQHPADLPAHLAERLGVGRRSALALVRKLVEAQWLVREGTPRQTRHAPGALRQVIRHYPVDGLQEDAAWRRDFAPQFDLPAHVARMAQHVFTELLNNAADHSGGTQVTVSMRQTPLQVQLLVSDNGRGVFDAIQQAFGIDEPALAMLELAKGKLTSQPDRHSGRGLFFAAKLADVFDLHANEAAFAQRDWQRDRWVAGRPACRRGSSIYVAICLDTSRTLDAVLKRYSLDGDGIGFDHTVVPLALATSPQAGLESRALARRVAARLPQFKRAVLDFDGLTDMGHGFADELWRVFARQHPGLELVPTNMSPHIAALVASARAQAPA